MAVQAEFRNLHVQLMDCGRVAGVRGGRGGDWKATDLLNFFPTAAIVIKTL